MRSAPPIGLPLSSVLRDGFPADVNPATTGGTAAGSVTTATLTGHVDAHTMGAWTEVIASAPFEVGWVEVLAAEVAVSTTNTRALVDVGIGAAPNEAAVISSIDVSAAPPSTGANFIRYAMPIRIAKGTRIAARIQGVNSAETCSFGLILRPSSAGKLSSSRIVTMGDNRADSTGTLLTEGVGTAKGAWTEVIATTAESFSGLVVMIGQGTGGNTAGQTALIDVAVGAAGSEVAIISDLLIYHNNTEYITRIYRSCFARHIPAGSRLSARFSRTSTTLVPSVILLGIPMV